MTEYLKFVNLKALTPNAKTHRVAVSSHFGSKHLGIIAWYPSWRQYCFFPKEATIFNPECMETISAKCREMTANHRALREKK